MSPRPQVSVVWGAVAVALLLGLSLSTPIAVTFAEKANVLARGLHFDFLTWTAGASWIKLQQAAAGLPAYLPASDQHDVVLEYLQLTHDIGQAEGELDIIYADPEVQDKASATADLSKRLEALQQRQRQLAPLAESVLQSQVDEILGEAGLTTAGQPLPGVLYHISATPNLLVISPRDRIGTRYSTSLLADLPVERVEALETGFDRALDVSSLVVPTGGIGAYPTMIMQTSDINWLSQVIAHEWMHNYLFWHPLGSLYEESAELRTMNETTADIVGKELGRRVLERYYPEFAPAQAAHKPDPNPDSEGPEPAEPPAFDFRTEMHVTRVRTDELLAQGKIEEAEDYMEERRQVFWEHGYALRKINQAYFAFYGSYADVPGGAAGEDPVGPAVRELRRRSASLADFVNQMASLTSFQDLQAALADTSG